MQFPAVSTTGASLFPLLRNVLACLTWLGMSIVSVVCDGASDNWRMFTLQDIGDNMVYKIPKFVQQE